MKMRTALSFVPVANDVLLKAFKANPEMIQSYDVPFQKEMHKMYVQHLQNKERLDKLTTQASDALEAALEDVFVGRGVAEGDSYAHNDFYDTVAEAMFQATIAAFFGEKFATRENYTHFRTFDDGFPLLLAGLPLSKPKKALDALYRQLSKRGYHEGSGDVKGAGDFIAARAELFNKLEDTQDVTPVLQASFQSSIIWVCVVCVVRLVYVVYVVCVVVRARACVVYERCESST